MSTFLLQLNDNINVICRERQLNDNIIRYMSRETIKRSHYTLYVERGRICSFDGQLNLFNGEAPVEPFVIRYMSREVGYAPLMAN